MYSCLFPACVIFTQDSLFHRHCLFFVCLIFLLCLRIYSFANGLVHWGYIPGQAIPKTQKFVFEASLFNTQHYKVEIKGKVDQFRGKIAPLHFCVVAIEKGGIRVILDYSEQLYFSNYLYSNSFKLSSQKNIFIELIMISFNNMMYQQVDGLSMGRLLAPLMANIFVEFREKQLFDKISKSPRRRKTLNSNLLNSA